MHSADIDPELPEWSEAEEGPYSATRFGDPAALLQGLAAAGLGNVDCRQQPVTYTMSADDWWPSLLHMPDLPVKVRIRRGKAGRELLAQALQLGAQDEPRTPGHPTSAGHPVQAALERAQAKPGADPAAVEQAARQAAERRLRERGWLLPDGSVRAPDQGAWLVTARKPA